MTITDFAMSWFGLAGKNAIVTGGNTGLGQAFTLALAKGGANVLVPSLADDDGSTRAAVEAEGSSYEFVTADLTESGVPRRVVEACVERLGSIDILINSAGICPLADVTEFDRKPWDATVAVNLTAAFELSHEATTYMIPQRSGKIINICSMFSFLGGRLPPT
jgi:NAD(P)-dependent dehydrogenase (short-subunit alcohol dehydrogenase family)